MVSLVVRVRIKPGLTGARVAALSKLRILVVDDEPFVCDALKMMLAFDGHVVDAAYDGKQGLALFVVGKYNVVITDFAMPQMKGDELAAAIKAIDPAQPIVMITAYAEMFKSDGRPLTGVDCLINKPFLIDDLRSAIRRVLGMGATPARSAGPSEGQ
jgi:CheY-like chemotaxis protein